MAGARERNVQQAQILALPVLVMGGELFGRWRHLQASVAGFVGEGHEARPGVVDAPETAGEGQEHQRIFQALGLVHRDHLDQVGVAFEADDLLVIGRKITGYLAGQPADQGLLAFEPGTGRLQQLCEVQEVGEPALAVRPGLGGKPRLAIGELAWRNAGL